jgi:hypothetical protein
MIYEPDIRIFLSKLLELDEKEPTKRKIECKILQ